MPIYRVKSCSRIKSNTSHWRHTQQLASLSVRDRAKMSQDSNSGGKKTERCHVNPSDYIFTDATI